MGRCVHEADEKWGGESKGADEKWGGESVTPLMSHGQHGQRWKFTSFSIQKVARPSGTTLQLAVNSRKFHRCPCCPWDINVP